MTRSGQLTVVVLAAGAGVRMRSALPKVMHEAAGRPLLGHVLRTAALLIEEAGGGTLAAVVGAGRETVVPFLAREAPGALPVVQDPPLGTGDALRAAASSGAFKNAGRVAVLSGDVPLLTCESICALLSALEGPPPEGCEALEAPAVAFLTARLAEPGAYGRVIRDQAGEVARVVEAKDATPEERRVTEINGGVYVFDRAFLDRALPLLEADNAQGEYYLTDLLGIAVQEGRRVVGIEADPREILGVNSRRELAEVDALLRRRAAESALDGGATLIRPETITLDDTVVVEPDAILEPFVTLTGTTRIGRGARVGQGTVIGDSEVLAGATIRPYCVIERAVIGERAVVGPFARLREGTVLAEEVHIGNFVETKKARLARGAKANHLTYLGDVTVGEKSNVGAGVITCNYDGFEKHPTRIGSGVFVGSDVQLVAPVTIGDGAMIGAGTTVTKDVPADGLALSRSPQTVAEGGAASYRRKKLAAKAEKEAKAGRGA